MINVQELGKSFDRRLVVRKLSFRAPDGTITGLLGSNGAGKTTTLRMICGVLKPDSGSILVDDVTGDSLARQRRVGALLDHMGIYPRLTVRENLLYFGRLRGMPPESLRERVDQVLSVLGLESIADRRTSGFSQGERMKTASAARSCIRLGICSSTNQPTARRPHGSLAARPAETLAGCGYMRRLFKSRARRRACTMRQRCCHLERESGRGRLAHGPLRPGGHKLFGGGIR